MADVRELHALWMQGIEAGVRKRFSIKELSRVSHWGRRVILQRGGASPFDKAFRRFVFQVALILPNLRDVTRPRPATARAIRKILSSRNGCVVSLTSATPRVFSRTQVSLDTLLQQARPQEVRAGAPAAVKEERR